jgi:adenylylsulfate kinase
VTRGGVVWFTGLPASGKTTLARAVREQRPHAVLLDSDDLRELLGATSYAAAARDEFYRVVGALAAMLARQGHVVLVAATAPRRAHRDTGRTAPRFIEVWVRADRATCEARDPKGLYQQARKGNAPDLPGVGAPYEEPAAPDVIATGGHDRAALERLIALLADHGL